MRKATQIKKDIDKAKASLIQKAKRRRGIWENFGQQEVRELRDKHDYVGMAYGSMEERQMAREIEHFNQWCMNFDLSNLRQQA